MKESSPPNPDGQAAVARYFALSQPQLRAYVRSLVFNASDVDDLMQEVAVAAIENAARYDGSGPVGAWVIGIAKNKTLKYFERQKRQRLCFSPELVEALSEAACGEAACNETEPADSLEALQECLDKLERPQRELLVRRHQKGATARQLAQQMGYTDTRMSRLLNSLYSVLMKCVQGASV